MEVALKLGHTLWRKLFPDEIKKSDLYLGNTIFEFLQDENYGVSEIFGEFALNLPNISSDLDYKINLINYAIALKFGNKDKKAQHILSKVDWSAASNDFKIAEAVLSDRFEDASKIMTRIGKRSDIINEQSYHAWPLFKEFRKSDVFKGAYEEIFGYSFIAELERAADKTEEEIKEEFQDEEKIEVGGRTSG
jgi:pterin-4a-carbinolamine dehydratase